MKTSFGTEHRFGAWCRILAFLLAAGFLLTSLSSPGQKDKKKKKDEPNTSTTTLMSDEQQIDFMLSEMMGAWQVGDVEKLHSTFADDVSVVASATWAPPVMGWANYLAVYQQQRARMQKVRMDRTNTFIKVKGDVAWACYQWNFTATLDGQPMQSQGQTTVVMEKRNGHWVIVHNHMSLTPPPATTPTPQQAPAKPNGF